MIMADFITKEIYNYDIKTRFLQEIDVTKYPPRWWERLFEKSYKFERKNEKDLFEFTTTEIIEFYKYMNSKSFNSLMVININLTKYGEWALENNMIPDNQCHFYEIKNETLVSCLDKSFVDNCIISWDDLKTKSQELMNFVDVYVLYALFEGIKGKDFSEIWQLRMSDINQETRKVQLSSGRIIEVSPEFISVCENTDKEKFLVTTNGTKRNLTSSVEGYIYKQAANGKMVKPGQTVYRKIISSLQYLGLNKVITPNDIVKSGMIHYLNKKARELNITVAELFSDLKYVEERNKILYKYNFNVSTKTRFMLQYEDYLV